MKPRAHIIPCLLTVLWLLTVAGQWTLSAAPTNQIAKLEIHPSVFAYPNKPAEGRDPFFPGSLRVYSSNVPVQTSGPTLSDLRLYTILGTPPHVVALICNHTFAAGDEGDVITKVGQRMRIRCLRIDPADGTATVEANGVTQELHLSEDP